MPYAIRIQEPGGPQCMQWQSVEVGEPGPGEVRLRQTAVGLNYIDVYHRTGLYPMEPPFTPGMEAAGVVEAVGPGVSDLKVGDRVAYAMVFGSYAQERLVPADKMVKIPDSIDDQTAAAMMLQGMTVEYLIRRTYPVKAGDTVLFHAAAGGVGLIFCQWARHIGATVIGTVGSEEKAELARAAGCEHVVLYRQESFVDKVKEVTNGVGVPVVYDGVGKDTFMDSLDCLRTRGLMVSFGNASGPVDSFNLGILAPKGSLYVTRPTLASYNTTRAELEESSGALIDVVASGAVELSVNQSFPLQDAAVAHIALESRQTTGQTVLIP
ncbi:MAG: quinone oxidoreductase [Gammaproteobacteria bacterium]|nr:quinone oxidoreductase [Gammaproteobacteria bacterium]